jgi:hypothetical protein
MAYVALKRQRFGTAHLDVGDEVPHERGRNYNLMVRQGLVADMAEVSAEQDKSARAAKAAKARVTKLEGELRDARAEIKSLQAENKTLADQASAEGESSAPEAGSTDDAKE